MPLGGRCWPQLQQHPEWPTGTKRWWKRCRGNSAAALQASRVNRPFLAFPPWFDDSLVAAGDRDLCARGTRLAGHLRYDPGQQWRDVPPGQLYRQGMGIEQAIEPLYQQVRSACPREADSVLIGGTGFRCVGILDALERDLQRPVV